jgi:hypothetical protein
MSRYLHDLKGPLIVNVVVTDSMRETMALNIIIQLVGAVVKLSAIAKIRKYRGHHEGLEAMEVHGAPGHEMDCFIWECVYLFHNRQSGGHLSLYFCIQFFK